MGDAGDPRGVDDPRLELARLGLHDEMELGSVLRRAAELSARKLDVARVGIWVFEDEHWLRCLDLVDLGTGRNEAGTRIDLHGIPRYAAALRELRAIAASDARNDPRTSELCESYLEPLGIGAMLDCPIYRGGVPVGIVCHEHVGPPRVWTERELDFAASVADLMGALMEQAERLHAEVQLRRSLQALERASTLAALGRLAAGVAHDFNNLLGALSLQAEMLRKRVDLPEDVRRAAAEIFTMTREGAELVKQLENFSRDQEQAPGPVELGEVVEGLRPVLETLRARGVKLVVERPARAVHAWADRRRLEQVVVTLAMDARDAMPQGGTLRVAVRDFPGAAVLEVSDTGETLGREELARFFEPFAAARSVGKGSGMSLAIALRTVLQAGGRMSAHAAVGGGTLLLVELPGAAEDGTGPLPFPVQPTLARARESVPPPAVASGDR